MCYTVLTFTVPVLEDHIKDDDESSDGLEPLTVVLIICVVVLSVATIILVGIVCRRHRTAARHLVVIDEDHDDSSASLRTRLSPLHSNLLCSVTSDEDKVKSGFSPGYAEFTGSNGGLLATEGPISINIDPLEGLSALDGIAVENVETVSSQTEHLFVEGPSTLRLGTTRCRVDKLTQSISEYEIPLDLQWEFPRDRSVCDRCLRIVRQ